MKNSQHVSATCGASLCATTSRWVKHAAGYTCHVTHRAARVVELIEVKRAARDMDTAQALRACNNPGENR